MMDVGRLQKFEGSITAQGKLLLHGPLLCVEGISNFDRNSSIVSKPRELQVFLFEQSIIFSDIIGKKTQFTNPSYIYKNQIQVNNNDEIPRHRWPWPCRNTHSNRLISFFICRIGKQNADGRIVRESSNVTFNGSIATGTQLCDQYTNK